MTPQTEPIAATAAAPKPGPTGPRTEEGKARCRLNAFRHGLTSQVFVFTAEEAPAFHKHHAAIVKHYQPSGPVETSLVDEIAHGIWRLQRAHAIEEGIFAVDSATNPDDSIPGPTRAWLDQSKSLALLATYERRIRHSLDRDKSELADIQTARKQQAAEAMDRAVSLHRLAKAEGKPYDPSIFQTPPLTPESVFSPEVVSIESARREAISAAQARLAQLQKHPKAA